MEGFSDMLQFGDEDMFSMLGEPVTLSYGAGKKSPQVKAIIDREPGGIELEVGGAVVTYGGRARIAKSSLPKCPAAGAALWATTGSFVVVRVSDAPNETCYTLELAHKPGK